MPKCKLYNKHTIQRKRCPNHFMMVTHFLDKSRTRWQPMPMGSLSVIFIWCSSNAFRARNAHVHLVFFICPSRCLYHHSNCTWLLFAFLKLSFAWNDSACVCVLAHFHAQLKLSMFQFNCLICISLNFTIIHIFALKLVIFVNLICRNASRYWCGFQIFVDALRFDSFQMVIVLGSANKRSCKWGKFRRKWNDFAFYPDHVRKQVHVVSLMIILYMQGREGERQRSTAWVEQ